MHVQKSILSCRVICLSEDYNNGRRAGEEAERHSLKGGPSPHPGDAYCHWLSIYLSPLSLSFSFSLFWPHLWHMEVPRPGSNPSCGCDLHHSSSSSAGSLPHCTRLGIEPLPLQRQCQILNPIGHSRNSINFCKIMERIYEMVTSVECWEAVSGK